MVRGYFLHIIQFTQGTFLKLFLVYCRVKILQYSRENLNTQTINYEQVLSNNGKTPFNRKEALIELWEGQLCSATGWDEGKEKTAEGGRTKGTLWERDSLIITNIDVNVQKLSVNMCKVKRVIRPQL